MNDYQHVWVEHFSSGADYAYKDPEGYGIALAKAMIQQFNAGQSGIFLLRLKHREGNGYRHETRVVAPKVEWDRLKLEIGWTPSHGKIKYKKQKGKRND